MNAEERRALHIKAKDAQTLAIGRFVVEFEHMVGETRMLCISMLIGNRTDIWAAPLVFSHQALGANALWEILRAMIAQARTLKISNPFSDENLNSLIREMSDRFSHLTHMRNQIVHADWMLGDRSANTDEPGVEILALKWKLSFKEGGFVNSDAPSTLAELDELTELCQELADMIGALGTALTIPSKGINAHFTREHTGQWQPRYRKTRL